MNAKLKNEVTEIKHMAFAVEDIEQSLKYYKKFIKRNLFNLFNSLILKDKYKLY